MITMEPLWENKTRFCWAHFGGTIPRCAEEWRGRWCGARMLLIDPEGIMGTTIDPETVCSCFFEHLHISRVILGLVS